MVDLRGDDYIPKDQLIVGALYRIQARSYSKAIWNGTDFDGVRTKWGDKFWFGEYHYDDGAPYGTVKPYELLIRNFKGELDGLHYKG